MSLEEYRKLRKKKKPLKFRNKISKTPDGTFQSDWEKKRWGDLKMLKLAGKITELRKQVKYPLVVNGVELPMYIADFHYKDERGNLVVEDTKSEATEKLEAFRMKKALMLALYGIDVKVIINKSFKKRRKKK